MSSNISLQRLTHLSTLFKTMSNGKHINRQSEPQLWAELEAEDEAYSTLFLALGYQLRIDGRGFAWFHAQDGNSNVSKTSRVLALLFMVIFDTQSDAGKPLLRFYDWLLNREFLADVYEQHHELLTAENLDVESLIGLLESASRLGFVIEESGCWRLLPAVFRYLDHFEALADQSREEEGLNIDSVATAHSGPFEDNQSL